MWCQVCPRDDKTAGKWRVSKCCTLWFLRTFRLILINCSLCRFGFEHFDWDYVALCACVCECVQFVIQIEVWQWPNWRLMMSSFCALAGKPNVIAHCAGPVGPLLRCSVPQLAIWTRTTAAAHCNQSRTAKSGRGRQRRRCRWSRRRRRSVSGSRGNCLGRGKCKLRYDHNDQLAHVVIPHENQSGIV